MIGNRNLTIYQEETRASLSLQLHHCGIQQCTPGYHYTITMRPYHIIHFILDGTGTFTYDAITYKLNKGMAFIIPSGSSAHYTASYDNPWKYCWIGIYADNNTYLKSLFHDTSIIDIEMDLQSVEQHILSIIAVTDSRVANIKNYNESEFIGEQFIPITLPSQSLEVNSRLLHFFSELIKIQTKNKLYSSKPQNFALAAKSYIDTHFFETIKVQDVANYLHIHPNYLTQVFRNMYNQTPKEYLNSFRLHHAALLLTLTDYPISTIANAVGFINQYHFSTAFKKLFGDSPANYRKSMSK